jgi:hypothetical protein
MRLSTALSRDDDRSVAVIHAALDAASPSSIPQTPTVDTADTGHNERPIARALASWSGDGSHRRRDEGGLTQPDGQWVPTDARDI